MKRNKMICLLLALLTLSALIPCTASAESDLSYSAAIAYRNVIDNLAAKYGYAEHSDDGTRFGYARLIDFDSDGYTELLVAYNYQFDVYGYYENGLTLLHSDSCWAVGGFFDLELLQKGYNTFVATDSVADTSLCTMGTAYGTVENKKWVVSDLQTHLPCEPEHHIGLKNWYDLYYALDGKIISEAEFHAFLLPFVTIEAGTGSNRFGNAGTQDAYNTLSEIIRIKKPIRVIVKGKEVAFDQVPVIVEDRTLVPIRAIVEAMGGKVSWDSKTATATLTLETNVLKLTIGSKTAYLNGKQMTMDVPPQIIGDRTMIPVRFAAEKLNFTVTWDAQNKTITIN